MRLDRGFPSPATDYVRRSPGLNDILMPDRNDTLLSEKPEGFVLDKSLKLVKCITVASRLGKYLQLGKLFRTGIITSDG